MGLSNLSLERPSDLPSDVSDVYYLLQNEVESKFPDTAKDARDVIFCIAYTLYSKKKKALSQKPKDQGSPLLADMVLRLCKQQEEMDSYCLKAFDKLKVVNDEAGSNYIITSITSSIKEELEKKERISVRRFALNILMKGLEIVFLVLIVWLLAALSPFWKWLYERVMAHISE